MDKNELNKIAEQLIERAKQMSKEKILAFAEGIYGADRDAWEHLWQVPIVSTYKSEVIFPVELSSESREDIQAALDECVEDQIGDSEATFIPYDHIIASLSDEGAEEYTQGVESGNIPQEYDAVIVYNEARLKNEFREHVQSGLSANPPKSQEEINQIFLNLVSEIFTHERMHLNASVLLLDNNDQELTPLVNGAELEDIYSRNFAEYSERNEVLIDTMAKMIQTYTEGDTVEDCLYKVINSRDGNSSYEYLDDRLVLSLFTLFPEELSDWMMFGAYGDNHENLLQQKCTEVFGVEGPIKREDMLHKVGEYFSQTASSCLTEERITRRKEMLEMIGVTNIRLEQIQLIDVSQIEEVAKSEVAMEQLSDAERVVKIVEPAKDIIE